MSMSMICWLRTGKTVQFAVWIDICSAQGIHKELLWFFKQRICFYGGFCCRIILRDLVQWRRGQQQPLRQKRELSRANGENTTIQFSVMSHHHHHLNHHGHNHHGHHQDHHRHYDEDGDNDDDEVIWCRVQLSVVKAWRQKRRRGMPPLSCNIIKMMRIMILIIILIWWSCWSLIMIMMTAIT